MAGNLFFVFWLRLGAGLGRIISVTFAFNGQFVGCCQMRGAIENLWLFAKAIAFKCIILMFFSSLQGYIMFNIVLQGSGKVLRRY